MKDAEKKVRSLYYRLPIIVRYHSLPEFQDS